MTVRLHRGDLPDLSRYTELGGDRYRDHGAQSASRPALRGAAVERRRQRRCVQIPKGPADAPNLKALLANPKITKIFHFARFDLAALYNAFGVMAEPVYCTKIASRLSRTYTDRHGLKDLVREVLNVELSKQQQSSDWGAQTLSEAQLAYAASDVLHLHALRERLDMMLAREGRMDWRKPASTSCRRGQSSICKAGKPRTFSPIREREQLAVSGCGNALTVGPIRPFSVTLLKSGCRWRGVLRMRPAG